MEQYSDKSQQLQDYSLWEDDYFASVEMGMRSQAGFSDTNEPENFFYAKNVSIHPDDNNHRNDLPNAARNVSSPETANPAAKAKRRRSKGAAGSQSTTFLNASISNFRALVQQHTGCHNANSSPKGPITLCFATTPAAPRQYY